VEVAGTSTLAGTIAASGGVTIDTGASVSVLGGTSINSNLTNNGTLLVAGASATGIVSISGNYTQASGATLKMDIGGSTAGTGYDQLQIGGSATLNGTLNVSFLNGYSPPTGTTFKLLTYGSHSGTFSSITGTTMTPQYNSGDFSLLAWAEAEPEPSGERRLDDNGRPLDEDEEAPAERVLVDADVPPPWDEEARDLVFVSLGQDEPDGGEEEAPLALALEEGFTLPLAVLEALVEAVV
jgi:hypothetical protein